MRRLVLIASLAALWAIPSAADPQVMPGAYFRVTDPAAWTRLQGLDIREFPNGVVCVTAPANVLTDLSQTEGLEYLEPETYLEPVPVDDEPPPDATLSVAGVSGAVAERGCVPSDVMMPSVGWGVRCIYGDSLLLRPTGGEGIKIGMLDTGAYMHPDIVRRVRYCMDFTQIPPQPACVDDTDHGTRVAGIMVADGGADGLGVYGVAPDAELYVAKVCVNGRCSDATIAQGLYALVDQGVNIINISLGGTWRPTVLLDAIDYATTQGVLIVAAAGKWDVVAYPAAYVKVVSVAGLFTYERNGFYLVPYPGAVAGANDGDYIREEGEIEVAAPGYFVTSTPTSGGCYAYCSGTSCAAPHISGLAAKIWRGNASATRVELQRRAMMHDVYIAGDDTLTGFGLPQLSAPVAVDDDPEIADRTALRPYPNPFRTRVSMLMVLSQRAPVRFEVFDCAGRRVRAIPSGHMNEGAHLLEWDGLDDEGRPAPGGLYFLRLAAGERVTTARVVRLR